eukprot:gnl/TRDRNA2_/TRDRNA2_196364_c0_seq1.p1 gnl/TRDRNA2_/TRDRNA2_196364_c0~~gnl/TRDRNA2_/TRDRNA2_196364_c0_seq1.p1  ORF type:complete len:250 (-),score=34.17 gnl/TRDRNA2_/TRDRNA2_196364_c0_seq1:143-892(-)
MPTLFFNNHDGCGDIWYDIGHVRMQVVNTLTNVFFFIGGLLLVRNARSPEGRQSGILLIAIGFFSGVYHATSSWGGFILDITSMSVWATHLASCTQIGREQLGLRVWPKGGSQARLAAEVCGCAVAVGAPFVAFEVFDGNPTDVWNIWSTMFLLLVLATALPGLHACLAAGILRRLAWRVVGAIASILLGVVFTQLILALCVPGQFTQFPLHSGWHLCAATSAWLTAGIVDEALVYAATCAGAGKAHCG